uniref:Formamidopyrimidine-DNA glycosylase catalytic domain-containing protein n=1 Tax=Dunaliella tertiolecta TaxID=3047 RepID=A0A7S3QJP2_DUNTE|eukprot:CAMPEP_0202387306 /NCGR_PEP_ID=MMETSP1127-20130417/71303_1 /ASSEMBLY_ACC=CAM_ASM_000462 /TAXON_ID=3047 /ORGANISM="Dunaliella tertiolecta, Strain CCMP1320" /LENGTH=505 /DNA_ID=CAMNT_0048988241 /DNA_START=31 /DNA_END=1548 /DNA_ORIENTATION=-
MPEGPEVESAKSLVEKNLSGLRIKQAIVADDEKVFVNCKDTLQSALEGRRLLEVKRKGKYLWFLLDGEGPIPLIHFGMTGSIIVQGVGSAKYTRINIDTENWPPRFCKLELVFEGGKRMAFVDGRRFGKVKLQSNPLTEEPVSKLGFDFISEMPSLEAFTEALARFQRAGSSMRIKALLLDQAFAAGVGNWVADEVLYQARIHPEQPVADMEAAQIKAMHTKMLEIGQISVAANADYTEFPPDWLFHYRWTGKQASSIDGKKIDFITVGSRTSAYVPALQKLVKGSGLSSQKPVSKKAAPKAPKAAKAKNGQDAEEEGGKATKQQGSKRKASAAAAKAEGASPGAEQQDEEAAGELEEQQQQKPTGPQKGRGNKRKAPSSVPEAPVAAECEGATAEGDGAEDKAGAGRVRGVKQGNKRARVSAAAASPAAPATAPKKAAGKGGRNKDAAAAADGADNEDATGGAKPEAAGAKRGRQQGKTKAAAAAASAGASEKGARPKRGSAAK